MKILLAIDGSAYSKKVLDYMAEHQNMFHHDNQYTLLTVQTRLPLHVTAMLSQKKVDTFYSEEANKVLEPTQNALHRKGLEVKADWEVGFPGETIAAVAEKGNYDLVVMGSHGHGNLMNLVMGSVATSVVARCKVPVLLVR
jgi:nucleotide-binding universal stress UspA family protein